jgi:hypothetical protein
MSGGSHVLVDQAAQDRFSADLVSEETALRDAGRMVFSVRDLTSAKLVRKSAAAIDRFDGLAELVG